MVSSAVRSQAEARTVREGDLSSCGWPSSRPSCFIQKSIVLYVAYVLCLGVVDVLLFLLLALLAAELKSPGSPIV